MSMLFPGPYILDHVIRTGGKRGFGVLDPSWLRLVWVGIYRSFGQEADIV